MNHGEKRDQVGHHDTGARGPLESRSHWAEVHSVKLALAKKYRRYQSAASRLTLSDICECQPAGRQITTLSRVHVQWEKHKLWNVQYKPGFMRSMFTFEKHHLNCHNGYFVSFAKPT